MYIQYLSPEFYSVNFSTVIIFKVILITAVFAYYYYLQNCAEKRKRFLLVRHINKKNRFFSVFVYVSKKSRRKMVKYGKSFKDSCEGRRFQEINSLIHKVHIYT
jgi:hypothetical protein